MSRNKYKNRLLSELSPRKRCALFCFVTGMNISQVARELKASRNTISAWLIQPKFQRALIMEQRKLSRSRFIFRQCTDYQQRVFRILFSVLRHHPNKERICDKFQLRLFELNRKKFDTPRPGVFDLTKRLLECEPSERKKVKKMVEVFQKLNWDQQFNSHDDYEYEQVTSEAWQQEITELIGIDVSGSETEGQMMEDDYAE